MQSTSTLRAQASNLMATAKKKKATSIGQISYLTKQVASLEKDLIRKDIEKLDQKVDGVKTELSNKIEKLDQKVDNLETNLNIKIDNLKNYNKIILGFLGVLVTLFIGGFTILSNRIDTTRIELRQDINSRFDKMEKRFDKIERAIENINQKLK